MYRVVISEVVECEYSLHATMAEASVQCLKEEQDRGLEPADYRGTQICPQTGERLLIEIKEVKDDTGTNDPGPGG